MSNELGIDRSGNNNNWTENNTTLAVDQVLDSPTNNFATLNTLNNQANSTLSEGNLKAVLATGASGRTSSTFAVSSGKWYWEVRQSSANRFGMGVFDTEKYVMTDEDAGADAHEWAWLTDGGDSSSGILFNNSSSSNHGVEVANGEVIMVALDADNDAIWFGKENSWFNTDGSANSATVKTQIEAGTTTNAGHTSVTGTLTPVFVRQTSADTLIVNFGQDSSFAGNETAAGNTDGNGIGDFAYAPPSGFLALCTSNLPEPTVDPRNHFSQLLYTGDDSTDNDITGIGFETDFLWIKRRDATAQHYLFDSLRLYDNGHNKQLFSSVTTAGIADDSGSSNSRVRIIDPTDGFNLTNADTDLNASAGSYVAWNWKAGNANTSFTESGNNPGGIHRANVEAGFSIVSYTGTGAAGTVAHGLGAAPEWIFIKNRDVSDAWAVYYGDNTDYLVLNEDAATADAATYFNDTSPTTTVFTVNTAHSVNADGERYIAYCWRSIDGYSKLGSYEGNGNANGSFIYTGFKPAFIMIKELDNANQWHIIDNKRESELGNPVEAWLRADDNSAEASSDNAVDILSNGFKPRTANNRTNRAATLIYMAFAEIPFKYANAK